VIPVDETPVRLHVQVVAWDRCGGLFPPNAQAAVMARPDHAAIVADVVATLDASRSAATQARVVSSVSRLAAAVARASPANGPASTPAVPAQLLRAAVASGGLFDGLGGASDRDLASALAEAASAPAATENQQLTALANAATIAQCVPPCCVQQHVCSVPESTCI
jgi:hypothetical protein